MGGRWRRRRPKARRPHAASSSSLSALDPGRRALAEKETRLRSSFCEEVGNAPRVREARRSRDKKFKWRSCTAVTPSRVRVRVGGNALGIGRGGAGVGNPPPPPPQNGLGVSHGLMACAAGGRVTAVLGQHARIHLSHNFLCCFYFSLHVLRMLLHSWIAIRLRDARLWILDVYAGHLTRPDTYNNQYAISSKLSHTKIIKLARVPSPSRTSDGLHRAHVNDSAH